jgi:magnesium-transporting ATPase (P-type)
MQQCSCGYLGRRLGPFDHVATEQRPAPDHDDRMDTAVNGFTTAQAEQRAPRVLDSLRSTNQMTVTHLQQIFAGFVLNVLVNIVVLNLFVEFVDEVVIDSFVISILTAVLLTAMLGVLARFEHRIHHFFFEKHSWRFAGVITIWVVLFGGKFLILEVVNVVFGDHVSLGHLLEVILIVVTMMIAGQLMQTIYDRLGVDADEAPTEPSSRGDRQSPPSTST